MKVLSIFLLSLITWLPLSADEPCLDIYNTAFGPGEKVTYKVYYNWQDVWMGAGEVKFNVKPAQLNNRDCLHISAVGETYKRYNWFYKVHDVYESYVDPYTLLPLKFKRDVNEGGYTIYNDIDFDREKNKVHVEHEDFKTKRYNKSFDVPDCTQDVLSAIYYARNIDYSKYKPNDTIPVTIFLDNKIYDVYVRYLGKERIKTKAGKYSTIKFSPLLIEGNAFEGGEAMTVWVTDDKNKIPVLIETPLVVGSVKAVLDTYEGTRHDFTAKMD